jgi:hypothetical protein
MRHCCKQRLQKSTLYAVYAVRCLVILDFDGFALRAHAQTTFAQHHSIVRITFPCMFKATYLLRRLGPVCAHINSRRPQHSIFIVLEQLRIEHTRQRSDVPLPAHVRHTAQHSRASMCGVTLRPDDAACHACECPQWFWFRLVALQAR